MKPHWTVLLASIGGIVFAALFSFILPDRFQPCKKPWVFFDLGNTVITSGVGGPSHYLPGAHEYVRELRKRGYPVGLITNVPENWGRTRVSKIRELKKLIAETWTKEVGAEAMDWNDFPDPLIIVPPRNSERKPNPFLFRTVLARVALEEGVNGCPVVFQGEDPTEVEAAKKNGLRAYLVGGDPSEPFFPIERLEKL